MFYKLIGPRLLLLFGTMQIAAILEGFGISLMLPIIQRESDSNSQLEQLIDWAFNLVNVTPTLINSLIALIIFFLLRSAILIGQSWIAANILSQTLMKMRSDFVESLVQTKYSYIRTLDNGKVSNVMSAEIERVNLALSTLLVLMVSATTALVYIVIAILVAPVITAFLFVLVLPIGLLMIFINRATMKASVKYTDGSNRQLSLMFELLGAIKYLTATGRSNPIVGRIITQSSRVASAFKRLYFLQNATLYGLEPFIVIVLAVVIYFLVEVRNGDIFDILFLLFVFRTAAVSLVATQPAYRKFVATTGSLNVYSELRTNFERNNQSVGSNLSKPDFSGEIKLESVSYRYKDDTTDVLKNVSLSIPQRSTIALVGPSGSGKSTLANIIVSLLEPSSGNISISDTSYDDLDVASLRSNVGYVTQESVIFNSSIEDNITLWTEPVDSQKMAQIIKSMNLDNLITRANKLDSEELNQTGQGLSGGERQRVGIARELYWDSKLLVLDEATSSMDSLLEEDINLLIDTLRGEKTMIVIAHRLSTVKSADKIVVLNNGRVVEQGSFEQLTETDGLFTQMVKQQTL
jgi:ABC-type bacteriocin/lantibiotic exporter with double-glycine peptidase domain